MVLAMLWAAAAAAGEPSPGAIEELRVEGSHLGIVDERARAAQTPGGVTVVDMDELKERTVASLADAFRYVPGVWSSSSYGADSVFLSSRGSNLDATDYDGNGIKLLQDGLPVTTADGNNHNRVIDPLSAQYATVARGANAMIYGASTLGGAINFASPTARDRSGVELRLNAGSHGLGMIRATAGGVLDESLDGIVTVEAKAWDGYRDHSEQKRQGVYANAGWQVGDSVTTRFYGTYLRNDQALPGALAQDELEDDPDQASANAVGGHFQLDVDTWRIANKTTWLLGTDRQLELGVSLERQKLFHPIVDKVLVDFDGPGPLEPIEVFSLLIDSDHQDAGATARYQHLWGNHDLLFGVNYGNNRVDGRHYRNAGGRKNGLTTLIDNEAESWELFAVDHWRLTNRLTLVLAAQRSLADRKVRSRDVNGGVLAPKGDYSSVSPRIGATWETGSDSRLYTNLSRLYEPPTNFEVEDDVRASNETLDAMRGTVVEIGTRGSRSFGADNRWYWDASAYWAWIRDEILSVDDPSAPGTSLTTNVDDTVHAGIEALIGAQLRPSAESTYAIEPALSVTVNRFAFDGDSMYGDNQLPAAPDYVLRGELLYRADAGYYFGPTFDLVGDRWADFANTYQVDSYGLLGLRTGWEGRRWRVFFEVHNLLDESYVATHSVRNVAGANDRILYPGAGRSAYAGLVVAF